MDPSWSGSPLLPEGLLAVLILVIIILDALFWPRRLTANLGYLTLCGLLLVLSASLEEWTDGASGRAFHDLVFLDTYATFFDLLVLAAALGALLLALGGTDAKNPRGEFYPLLLVSVLGLMLTAAAADLLVVYLGLELASLPLWGQGGQGARGTGPPRAPRQRSRAQVSDPGSFRQQLRALWHGVALRGCGQHRSADTGRVAARAGR